MFWLLFPWELQIYKKNSLYYILRFNKASIFIAVKGQLSRYTKYAHFKLFGSVVMPSLYVKWWCQRQRCSIFDFHATFLAHPCIFSWSRISFLGSVFLILRNTCIPYYNFFIFRVSKHFCLTSNIQMVKILFS